MLGAELRELEVLGLRPAWHVVLLAALGEDQRKHFVVMPDVFGDGCREVALASTGGGEVLSLHVI